VPGSTPPCDGLIEEVEREIERDGSIEVRLSATRRLVDAGFRTEAIKSLARLERMAQSPARLADVALLAAQAGDTERASQLASSAEPDLITPDDPADELAICALASVAELLGQTNRAADLLERLARPERADCAATIAVELARVHRLDRARKWAEEAGRSSGDVRLAIARVAAEEGNVPLARETLRTALRELRGDSAKQTEAAEVYSLMGDTKEAARLAKSVRTRVLDGTGSGEPAYLIRAALAVGDRTGASELAEFVANTPSLIVKVQAAMLYLDFAVDPPLQRADRVAAAVSLLAEVERALADETETSYLDSVRAHLAHARLRTNDVARAIQDARAISGLPTRLATLIAIAAWCKKRAEPA
jgi:hypothetical protein